MNDNEKKLKEEKTSSEFDEELITSNNSVKKKIKKRIVMHNTYLKEIEKAQKFYEKKKRKIKNRKGWDTFKSIIWIIFCGISITITTIALGVSYCVTLIGIPFGIVYFKSIKLMITPVNKRIVLHFGRKPFWNIIWLLFGGIGISITYFIVGLLLKLTIIFSSFAEQYFKFAKFFLAPFGVEILHKYEFETEEDKKIIYTYQYIKRNNTSIRYMSEESIHKEEIISTSYYATQDGSFINSSIPKAKLPMIVFNYKMRIIRIIYDLFLMILVNSVWWFIPILFHLKNPVIGDSIPLIFPSVGFIINILGIMFGIHVIMDLSEKNAAWYGYMNIPKAIEYLNGLNSIIKNNCKEYYEQHSEQIDEFIKQEYVYQLFSINGEKDTKKQTVLIIVIAILNILLSGCSDLLSLSIETFEENGQKYVYLGEYPQTVVEDEYLITKLSKITTTNEKGYIEYNGWEFKKVIASTYESTKKYVNGVLVTEKDTYYFENGEPAIDGNIYFFVVESIKWRVLEETDGTYKLISEKVLDNMPFNMASYKRQINGEEIYPNNYKYSSIRAWLNGYNGTNYQVNDYTNKGFYNIAFSKAEMKKKIRIVNQKMIKFHY